MSDYKRLVAYIYAYEKEQKGNNVGFAKIEARNGECRIGIHLRGIYTGTQSPLKAFAFVRRSSGIYGILLGEFRIVNGVGDFKSVTDAENLMDTGISLDDIGGLYIWSDGAKNYATEWDDQAVQPAQFYLYSELKSREATNQREDSNILLKAAQADLPPDNEMDILATAEFEHNGELFSEEALLMEEKIQGLAGAEHSPEAIQSDAKTDYPDAYEMEEYEENIYAEEEQKYETDLTGNLAEYGVDFDLSSAAGQEAASANIEIDVAGQWYPPSDDRDEEMGPTAPWDQDEQQPWKAPDHRVNGGQMRNNPIPTLPIEIIPEEPMVNGAMPEEPMSEGPMPGGLMLEEPMPERLMPEEPMPERLMPEEPMPDNAEQNEIIPDHTRNNVPMPGTDIPNWIADDTISGREEPYIPVEQREAHRELPNEAAATYPTGGPTATIDESMPKVNMGAPQFNIEMPSSGAGMPSSGAGMPSSGAGMPSPGADIPNADPNMPAAPLPASPSASESSAFRAASPSANATPSAETETSAPGCDISGRYVQPSQKWENMKNTFPGIVPFEDKETIECIRIEPKDLIQLPKEEWILGNNSFLLHGYYYYRYLLLGKMKKGGETFYVLGIPGIYDNREKMMAVMFGFPNFKPVKKIESKIGQFGFWYKRVRLTD